MLQRARMRGHAAVRAGIRPEDGVRVMFKFCWPLREPALAFGAHRSSGGRNETVKMKCISERTAPQVPKPRARCVGVRAEGEAVVLVVLASSDASSWV